MSDSLSQRLERLRLSAGQLSKVLRGGPGTDDAVRESPLASRAHFHVPRGGLFRGQRFEKRRAAAKTEADENQRRSGLGRDLRQRRGDEGGTELHERHRRMAEAVVEDCSSGNG